MKILFTVEFYEPKIGGAQEVISQVARRLVRAGHDVTVATSKLRWYRRAPTINGVHIAEFKLRGNTVTGIRGGRSEIERYQDFLRSGFDLVLNYAAQSWPTDLALPILGDLSAKKVLVPCGYSGLHRPQYAEYFKRLPGYLAQYDALVYMSPHYQDKTFGDEHGLGEKAALIPNGASREEFSSPDEYRIREKLGIREPILALCVANHYVAKGHGFVWKAFQKMKRRDASLLFVGSGELPGTLREFAHWVLDYWPCRLRAWLLPRVYLVDGRDRNAVLSAYKEADLFLFGSRVECAPLVMYESFAAGVPFVTTPVGNVADHKEALCIAHTPEEMADIADELSDNEAKRHMLVREGRRIIERGRQWEEIAKRYETLFKQLVDRS